MTAVKKNDIVFYTPFNPNHARLIGVVRSSEPSAVDTIVRVWFPKLTSINFLYQVYERTLVVIGSLDEFDDLILEDEGSL